MNLEEYNALPQAYKDAFEQALAEARQKSVESYQNNMKEMRVLMEDFGMEFLELDSGIVAYLQDSARSSYEMLASEIGGEWLTSLQEALKAEQ